MKQLKDQILKKKVGQLINLEKPMKYGQNISGHFIQGHVDTTATVESIKLIDRSWSMILELKNKNYVKYLEEKASISINGVSLTISNVAKKIKFKYNSTHVKINQS